MKALGLCFGFGLTLGVQIYLIGVVAGGWLDTRLNSAPWCMVAGILLAITLAFWQLLRGLNYLNKKEDKF